MEKVVDKGPKPTNGDFVGFDHLEFWVGNALQAANWYCGRFGFEPVAYRGLETGSREVASHVIRQNNIIFVLTNPVQPGNETLLRNGKRLMVMVLKMLLSLLTIAIKHLKKL